MNGLLVNNTVGVIDPASRTPGLTAGFLSLKFGVLVVLVGNNVGLLVISDELVVDEEMMLVGFLVKDLSGTSGLKHYLS